MQKKFKLYAIYLLLAAAFVFVSVSFSGKDISSREIILGIGIDYDETTRLFTASAEVVSPGGSDNQQTGSFSKVVSGSGDTMENCFADMYADTGMTPSLGQCQLLILGETLYKAVDLREITAYFCVYDAFRDSAAVCCAEGDAKNLLNTGVALSKSVSGSLVNLLSASAENSGATPCTLNDFVKKQMTAKRGFCSNLVRFVEQTDPQNPDADGENLRQGSYDCKRKVAFADFRYVTTLDDEQSAGYALLFPGVTGQTFTTENDEAKPFQPQLLTVGVSDKKVGIDCNEDGSAEISVLLTFKGLRAGQVGKGGNAYPKNDGVLSQEVLDEAAAQARRQIKSLLDEQTRLNFDAIGVFDAFHKKFGKSWSDKADSVSIADVKIDLTVAAQED